ncbi:MAG: response regulator [Pseudomonadales bacterium]|nr:response regulator [Pseudomonadales bacterium]
MNTSEIPILVVDDARFSTTVITRSLQSGGFTNIRHVDNALQALDLQLEDPASIVIADWLMPVMDGLEMTKRIRQMDEATNRYTYVIMLTARDGINALKHAFDEGVDDFVNKSVMQQQLLPRIYAAERLANNQNRLLRDNEALLKANQALKGLCTLDPLTGLGNKTYALNKLADNLRHTASRGGATCLLQLNVVDTETLQKRLPKAIINELIIGISRRLKSQIRPLDDISRMSQFSFTVVTHQPGLNQCESVNFKRIKDAINNRAFQTSMGYQSIRVELSLAATTAEETLPKPQQLIVAADKKMREAIKSRRIETFHFSAMAAVL